MEWSSWTMIEQAKEELEILEAQHPNRFDYLKLELKSFIFLLESQNLLLIHNNNIMYCDNSISLPISSTAITEASTSRKRKKGGPEIQEIMEGNNEEASKHKFQRVDGYLKKRDRVDVVIERARACLRKIRELKTSFCYATNSETGDKRKRN